MGPRAITSRICLQEGWHDNRPRSFLIYAPSRTAVVYAPVDDKQEQAPAPVASLEAD